MKKISLPLNFFFASLGAGSDNKTCTTEREKSVEGIKTHRRYLGYVDFVVEIVWIFLLILSLNLWEWKLILRDRRRVIKIKSSGLKMRLHVNYQSSDWANEKELSDSLRNIWTYMITLRFQPSSYDNVKF